MAVAPETCPLAHAAYHQQLKDNILPGLVALPFLGLVGIS